jgi:cell wall-associated NlpC family hydrolase
VTIEAFVRVSGQVMGQVRESFGPGGDRALTPAGGKPTPGQPQGSGQAADASATDSQHVGNHVTALDSHDTQGSAQLGGAAGAASAGRARMDAVIAAAVADVNALGMSTNSPQGRAALVAAIKRHLEDSKSTLDGAAADASTRAAAANTTTAAYNATAPAPPAGMMPQAASMLGSTMPAVTGMAGMAGMPASMMSGLGGAMPPLSPLTNLMHGDAPDSRQVSANIPDAAVTNDRTVAGGAVRRALAQLGKPYVWGATGPNAFDCSGLVQYAYKGVGVDLPRETYGMIHIGQQVAPGQAQAGDLVFSNFSARGPEHVQLAIGGGQVVEAQQSGVPVKVSAMPAGHVVVKRVVA